MNQTLLGDIDGSKSRFAPAGELGPLLDDPQFRAAFDTHPPHAALLGSIATLLVTCEQPGLIGCAALADERVMPAPA